MPSSIGSERKINPWFKIYDEEFATHCASRLERVRTKATHPWLRSCMHTDRRLRAGTSAPADVIKMLDELTGYMDPSTVNKAHSQHRHSMESEAEEDHISIEEDVKEQQRSRIGGAAEEQADSSAKPAP